jgi:hypothetical protein
MFRRGWKKGSVSFGGEGVDVLGNDQLERNEMDVVRLVWWSCCDWFEA